MSGFPADVQLFELCALLSHCDLSSCERNVRVYIYVRECISDFSRNYVTVSLRL